MSNLTSMSELLLLEFSEVRELQILHACFFLVFYLLALMGNFLIIIAIALDPNLHTPMYFFLMNLAMLDMGSVSVVLPQSIANSAMNRRSISYYGCIAQVFFLLFFGSADFALLTVMAYDRYVAICNPLRYETIMHQGACVQMIIIVWIFSLFYATLHTGGTFAVVFCSNVVHQFFCEVPELLMLSCSDLYLLEVGFLAFCCFIVLGCFSFIILTYVQIFASVVRVPSIEGQKKALSTCIPHLTVVSVLIFSGVFAYIRPPNNTFTDPNIVFAVIYTTIPPLANPFIYSMRNKEIKAALWKHFEHFSKTISS